ncbi:MAG: hypothetical protein A2283_21725 [Lentisphaerae bacterium RIFOXYA12_FULL_48_11]|nr:MAG: hypothetical protein A2283_21725 [Lentisphaerae bacterium RIFOXYA12_FULL_48_11]
MRNLCAIWRRELAACFLSPIAYVTMVFFLIASGSTFLVGVIKNAGSNVFLTNLLFASVVMWLTVLISIVSMRLFTEEVRSGTIEMLMTAPVTETEVVLGKYAGAVTFVLVIVAPAIANIFALAALNPSIGKIDEGAVVGGCIITFLVIAFCMSMGLLVSLMTKNQIAAAITCLCLIWIMLFLGNIVSAFPFMPAKLVAYLSVLAHVDEFSRGSIDSRPVILYLSGSAFMLFTAVRVLESKRWK